MEARAILRYYRASPRKVRLVLDLTRGKYVGEALDILANTPKKPAQMLHKLISSAVENARQKDVNVDVDSLYVKDAFVDEGPTLRRWIPRARGRATRIRKRTSHITIIISDE
jgi:large subunit ribosomal protein L22